MIDFFMRYRYNIDIHHMQYRLLQLAVISLPFGYFSIKIPVVGYSVPNAFLLLGYVVYLIEKIIYHNPFSKYERYGIYFLLLLIGWNIFSGLIDIESYRFYYLLDINQDEKLAASYWNLKQFMPVDTLLLTKLSLTYNSIRSAVFSTLFGYFIALWIIHIYNNNPKRAFRDINYAIHILCIILSVYSVVEVGYLLGSFYCKDWLIYINPLYMRISYLNDWWPPLLWTNLQVRSMFAEPSFFGMFLAMALPLLISDFYKKQNKVSIKIVLYVLYIFMVMLLIMSKARTASMLFLGEMLLFFLWQAFIKKTEWRSFIRCIVCTIFAIALGMLCIFHFQAIDIKVDQTNATSVQSYVNQNITSVVGDQRSNSARKANNISTFKVGLENPFFGVGTELVHEYIGQKMTMEDLNNPEVKKWTSDMNEKGPLKSGYPILNQIAWSFATQGGIGVILFLFPIIFIFYRIIRCYKILISSELTSSFIAFCGLVMAFFSNAAQLEYFILCGLMMCFIQDENNYIK